MNAPHPELSEPRLTVYPDILQGSDEWLAQRRGIVTASVVGNLITVRKLSAIDYPCTACGSTANEPCRSKVRADTAIKTLHTERAELARRNPANTVFETANNDTSRSLTALLVAERITGWTDPTYISDDMLRGFADEPIARHIYSEHYGPVHEAGFMVREYQGIRIGYSPDGLVADDGLIEIKSRRPKIHLTHVLSGQVPAENMAQCQTGLLVSGRKWLDYVSYSGGMHLWIKRVYPDQRWFDAITAAVEAFEANAREMQLHYFESVADFPMTDRIIEQEMVI
jgi:hypothetical protein